MMILTTEDGRKIDFSKGIDLSIPMSSKHQGPLAWHVNPPQFNPVMENDWVGLVEKGGTVNFFNIHFNPHGNGTHTECLGHITSEVHSINQHLKTFFFTAVVISVNPTLINGDYVVTKEQLKSLKQHKEVDALIIRTLPNSEIKKSLNYSSTNPPYLDVSCLEIMNQLKVKHLLVDLPSVDKEKDEGKLAFHRRFWEVDKNPRFDKTITEMIYVSNEVEDGEYLLNLQVAPFEIDASPSRPVIYPIE